MQLFASYVAISIKKMKEKESANAYDQSEGVISLEGWSVDFSCRLSVSFFGGGRKKLPRPHHEVKFIEPYIEGSWVGSTWAIVSKLYSGPAASC